MNPDIRKLLHCIVVFLFHKKYLLFPKDGLYNSERLSPLIVTENIGREADDVVLLTEFQSSLLTLSEWNNILFRNTSSEYIKHKSAQVVVFGCLG